MKEILAENETMKMELTKGIVTGTFKVTFIDLDIAKKLIDSRIEALQGKSYPMLINIAAIKKMTKEARVYMASEEACKGVTAAAIITGTLLESVIGNFFTRINKPVIPTKLFSDETDAIEWLSTYLQ